MLFLAATNDRNHAVSPPNNIKLRPHSIDEKHVCYLLVCFVSIYVVLLAYDEQHVCYGGDSS
jgi:hypothetical protein